MSSRLLGSVLLSACIVAGLVSGCAPWADEPDGSDILFVREEEDDRTSIYLMSHDGRQVRRLVRGDAPRWSPDGTRFAYVVDEDDWRGPDLWVMNAGTGERRRLVRAPDVGVHSVAWAPDGVRLAYAELSRIFVVDTETGDVELFSLEFVEGPLDWSPDGRELLVSSTASAKILDVRTGAERRVAPRRFVRDGRWSPDGERVALAQVNASWNAERSAFDLPASGRMKSFIVVAERDGANSQRVTHGAFDSQPAWSADGAQIYFSREPVVGLFEETPFGKSEIYVIDLETRSLRRLTRNDVEDRSPDVRPAHRSLPDRPEPRTGGVVVPDLVGRHVLFKDERRRFDELGLKLKAVFPPMEGVLAVVREQAPQGGSRVQEGTVVKLDLFDLLSLYAGRAFSAKVWKTRPDCAADNPRGPMYSDLVSRVLRKGMSRERVFSLLGDPRRSEGRAHDWPIGRNSLVRIDCIYLRVHFDSRDRTTRFHQWPG